MEIYAFQESQGVILIVSPTTLTEIKVMKRDVETASKGATHGKASGLPRRTGSLRSSKFYRHQKEKDYDRKHFYDVYASEQEKDDHLASS